MSYTKFNASFRQSAVAVAQELGLEFISTKRQVNNGTLMFNDPETGAKYSMHESGYVRRHVKGYQHRFMKEAPTYMYPLNKRESWTVTSRMGWKYQRKGSPQLAGPNEQLGIFVRGVMNYRLNS